MKKIHSIKTIVETIDEDGTIEIFEKTEARDFNEAEANLGTMGRNWQTAVFKEANIIPENDTANLFDREENDNEANLEKDGQTT